MLDDANSFLCSIKESPLTTEASPMALLTSPVRREIMQILGNLPVASTADEPRTRAEGLTASELGDRIGLHATTVRFHVDQLLGGGLLLAHDVKVSVGRPRRHYVANPGSITTSEPGTYRLLAGLLADSFLDAQSEGVPQTAEEAAAQWVERNRDKFVPEGLGLSPAKTPGHFLAKAGALVDVLQTWGYTTKLSTTDDGQTVELGLNDCPIRELAQVNPGVACGVHRGLIQATMATLGEDRAAIGLVPFIEPDLCIARVSTARNFRHQEEQ
ncbi:transcriptional regulator [Propioniciclava tarda]|uniref:Transcriptional regulator n=1 Tax=Propioniciclava tarda TaxID=433330 RepID=A0A4Q9KKA3_PROTD|nr:transcriptional regulator [Propioniciclava tarda]